MPSPYRSRKRPNYLLRAEWHNYRSRCKYMITIAKAERAPRFSQIAPNPETGNAKVNLTPVGEIVDGTFSWLASLHRDVEIEARVVMPDHIHFLIYINHEGLLHLGDLIKQLKAQCTRTYWAAFPESPLAKERESLFAPGFNDKIVYTWDQAQSYAAYIRANPHRYLIKKTHPEFFSTIWHLSFRGAEYHIYGNHHLLIHPQRECVRISRSFSLQELRQRERAWAETARSEGVLVSPFYSPREKAVRDHCLEAGVSVIQLMANGFPERFCPSGRWFELCTEGRVLIVAPPLYSTRAETINRPTALHLNSVAEAMAVATPDEFHLRPLSR